MKTRMLGGRLEVSEIGYGAMGLAGAWGGVGGAHGGAVLPRPLDAGVTMTLTSDAYGGGSNEQLVGRAIAGRRDDAVIATKWGISPGEHSNPAEITWAPGVPVYGG